MAEGPASVVIVNPAAGGGRAPRVAERLARLLESRGEAFGVELTSAAGEAGILARRAAAAGARKIYVVGGDGTFNEAINGLFGGGARPDPQLLLAVVPAGTGCDLARTLARLGRAEIRMDVGVLRCVGHDDAPVTRYFANVASCGQSAAVALASRTMPRWFGGTAAYLLAILRTLWSYRAAQVCVRGADGFERCGRLRCVALGNGRVFGGGLAIAPYALPDDGLLDVAILDDAPVGWLLANVWQIYRGRHAGLRHLGHHATAGPVELASGEVVAIEADGEVVGRLPATVDVLAGALRVVLIDC